MSRSVKAKSDDGNIQFRSGLEKRVYSAAQNKGVSLSYETLKIPFLKKGVYTPDFCLPNRIIIEAKGYFDALSRSKMAAIKKSQPTLDIRFVFSDSSKKVRKGSDMTYADWCIKHKFLYADKEIPASWYQERKKSLVIRKEFHD
jgi:hypothetical protein